MLATQESTQTDAPVIPSSLIYEVLNGRPLYYRGYKEVLAKNLDPESITGNNALQSVLTSLIYGYVTNNRQKKRYLPVTNEVGVHLAPTDTLICDVAIFEKGTFAITTTYFDVPPKIVIEVDVKIDLSEFDGIEFNYTAEKNQLLFDFGVERVLWVLSKPRRVMVAAPNQDWIFTDWGNDIPVMEGCVLNVKNLLDEEGIVY